jgi:hypothetical protein
LPLEVPLRRPVKRAERGLQRKLFKHLPASASYADSREHSQRTDTMSSGLLVTVLMAISVALRWFGSIESPLAMFVGGTGVIVLLLSGVLGLYLVHGLAIGVRTDAETPVDEVPGARPRSMRATR